MARRRTGTHTRKITGDPLYNDQLAAKFINSLIWDGKKILAQKIFYGALNILKEKTGQDGFEVFKKALETIKPSVQVKSRRVGGATYQVPVEVYSVRKRSLAIKWILQAARARKGKDMQEKLAAELLDASKEQGAAFKKKDEVRRMAEANKAFSHYAW